MLWTESGVDWPRVSHDMRLFCLPNGTTNNDIVINLREIKPDLERNWEGTSSCWSQCGPLSLWTSATEYHRRGGGGSLDNRCVFSWLCWVASPRSIYQIWCLVSDRLLICMGYPLLVPIVVERKRGRQRVGPASFYKGIDPSHEGTQSWGNYGRSMM